MHNVITVNKKVNSNRVSLQRSEHKTYLIHIDGYFGKEYRILGRCLRSIVCKKLVHAWKDTGFSQMEKGQSI